MSKYSTEFKYEVVKRYLEANKDYDKLRQCLLKSICFILR